MELKHFICRDEEEREWLLDMHRRLTPYSRRATAVLGLVVALCLPWFDLWSMLPMALAGVAFGVGAALVERRQRIEPLVAGWFVAQGLVAVAIGVNGRQHVGDLAILMFAGIGASGGFPTRLVVVCTAYTAGLMVALGLGLNGSVVSDDPPRLLVPLGMLLSVQILATAVRQASIEHRTASVVDSLTGMFNRTALAARAAELEYQTQWNGEPTSTVMVDIDHFKSINDQHGHARGDAVLCDFAYLMRKELRSYDSAYRLGGEEFLVLAPGLDGAAAFELAERLRAAVRAAPIDGLPVTASFGVATSHADDAFSLDDTLALADAALYEAKRGGRDRVVGAQARVPAGA